MAGRSSMIAIAVASVMVWLLVEECLSTNIHFCQPAPYNLELKHKGCTTIIVPTDTCKGLCTSHSEPDLQGYGRMVEHCKCCIPRTMQSTNVTLECPGLEDGAVVMRVPKATKCKCRPCDKRTEL